MQVIIMDQELVVVLVVPLQVLEEPAQGLLVVEVEEAG